MFITIEGIDGSGKSTQTAKAFSFLQNKLGYGRILWTMEPGDWAGGELLRQLLLHTNLTHPLSELFLFLVDRCEHVYGKIRPALEEEKIVLCERYTDSTIAYQSWGRGIPLERLEDLFAWSGFPVPDITLWLDVPVDLAVARVNGRGKLDRIESDGKFFQTKVRAGYLALMHKFPDRIKRIDASGSIEAVAELVQSELRDIM